MCDVYCPVTITCDVDLRTIRFTETLGPTGSLDMALSREYLETLDRALALPSYAAKK